MAPPEESTSPFFILPPSQVYGRAIHVSATLGAFITSLLGDAATGSLEKNTPKRARELRNLLSGLG